MGCHFTLDTANTVANLTFGKVMACYRDIYSSNECYGAFMRFLKEFRDNMYSNRIEEDVRKVDSIREILLRDMNIKNSDTLGARCRSFSDIGYDESFVHWNREALWALRDLSDIFSRCKIKSLLLPQTISYRKRMDFAPDFMTSLDTMRELVNIHEGDTCLILQPEEAPGNLAILDAFPNYSIALRQANRWPAVLFWDDQEDYAFVPVKDIEELLFLYDIVRVERRPLPELRRIAKKRQKSSHYFIHISDLHFGLKNSSIAEERLTNEIDSYFRSCSSEDVCHLVVTGDVVDSPDENSESQYTLFSKRLQDLYGLEPILVLGNHDIDDKGIAITPGRRRTVQTTGNFPRIERSEETKTLFLLFNSNTEGVSGACGKIGDKQLSGMTALLNKEENLDDYLLVAVLHHHVLPRPVCYGDVEKWYDTLYGVFREKTLELKDSKKFIEWLEANGVKLILHGHRHTPFITEHGNVHIVACGSSTGYSSYRKNRNCLSYNLISLDDNVMDVTHIVKDSSGLDIENVLKPDTVFLS